MILTGVPSSRSVEVLLPAQNVSARGLVRLTGVEIAGVVPDDPARQVEPERHDLTAVPADVLERARPQRRGPDLLLEDVTAALCLELLA